MERLAESPPGDESRRGDGSPQVDGNAAQAIAAYIERVAGTRAPAGVVDAAVSELAPGATRGTLDPAAGGRLREIALREVSRQTGSLPARLGRLVRLRFGCGAVPARLAQRGAGGISAAEVSKLYHHLDRCPDCAGLATRFDAAEWDLQLSRAPEGPPPPVDRSRRRRGPAAGGRVGARLESPPGSPGAAERARPQPGRTAGAPVAASQSSAPRTPAPASPDAAPRSGGDRAVAGETVRAATAPAAPTRLPAAGQAPRAAPGPPAAPTRPPAARQAPRAAAGPPAAPTGPLASPPAAGQVSRAAAGPPAAPPPTAPTAPPPPATATRPPRGAAVASAPAGPAATQPVAAPRPPARPAPRTAPPARGTSVGATAAGARPSGPPARGKVRRRMVAAIGLLVLIGVAAAAAATGVLSGRGRSAGRPIAPISRQLTPVPRSAPAVTTPTSPEPVVRRPAARRRGPKVVKHTPAAKVLTPTPTPTPVHVAPAPVTPAVAPHRTAPAVATPRPRATPQPKPKVPTATTRTPAPTKTTDQTAPATGPGETITVPLPPGG